MKKRLLEIFAIFTLITSLAFVGCSSEKKTVDGDDDLEIETETEIDGDDELEIEVEIEAEVDKEDGDSELEEELEEEEENNELLLEKINLGIFWLENAETELSNQAFKEAFEINSDNPQARFGYAFTEAMVGFDMFFMIIQALEGQVGKKKSSYPGGEEFDDEELENINEWFDEAVFDIMDLMGGHFLRAVDLYTPLKESGGLSIHFDHLPIHLGIDEYAWISGEIDDADVFIFDGMARMAGAIFNLVEAHSIRSDLYAVVSKVASNATMLDNLDLPIILGMVTYLLNGDERFLSLREDVGVEKMNSVRELLMGALEDNILAAQAAEEEWEVDKDQDDEAFSVVDDKGEKIFVMNVWRHNAELGEDKMDAIPILDPDIIVAVNDLRDHLKNGGDPVPFDNTLSLVLSSALMIPIGYGMLDYLNLSPQELLGLEYSNLEPGTLNALLLYILNMNVVALDLHTFFENPVGLRQLLPLWSTDQGLFENTMYIEWECPAELLDDGLPNGSGTFVCAGSTETVPDTLVDAAHFQSLPDNYSIDADGHTVKSPYIAMQDPTFNDALYLDIKKLKLESYPDDPQWQKADQLSFNAALGKILAGVLGFLSK